MVGKLIIPLVIIAVSIYNHGVGHALNFIIGLFVSLIILAGVYAGGKAIWAKFKN